MKKLIKYMCVLAVAALATIVIMYNMASADGEGSEVVPPSMTAENVSTSEDTAAITVSFGGDIQGVTSGYITVDCPDGISCTSGESEKMIDDSNGVLSRTLTFSGFSSYSGNEATITFNIGKSSGWTYISKSQGKSISGSIMHATAKVKIEKQEPDPVDPPEEEFKLDTTIIEMKVGESKDLPGNNKKKDVQWTTSDETVVEINGNSVKGLKKGDATLTAKTADNESAVLTVKVDEKTDPNDPGEEPNPGEEPDDPGETPTQPVVVPLKIEPSIRKMYVGEVDRYGVNKDVTITWSSSNKSVAIIDQSTGQVTAVGEGKATITATTQNGETATAQIIVERKSDGGNEVADPVISPSSDFTINAGDTYQLKADMEVEWTSSDESVATVDANGLVKGVGGGNAFIYAKSKDLRVSSIGVTVKGAKSKGNKGSTGGTKTNKTGNAATEDGNSSSTVNEEVPSTGEASTGTIVILGAVTLIVAAVIFRKRMK
ncbi:MAG: Ig-like domain-containing protein [Clostridia bacterium]|nr:Ig-like domain-containing protein [Clostridia bacterium]